VQSRLSLFKQFTEFYTHHTRFLYVAQSHFCEL